MPQADKAASKLANRMTNVERVIADMVPLGMALWRYRQVCKKAQGARGVSQNAAPRSIVEVDNQSGNEMTGSESPPKARPHWSVLPV